MDEKKIKINFLQAIRVVHKDAVGKMDKNELNNLTTIELKK